MAETKIEVSPIGTIVEVLSDKAAALAEAEVTITETPDPGGGHSSQITTTRKATWIVPAKVVTRGTKKLKDYFNYEVGEKVVLIGGGDDHSLEDWENWTDYDNFHNYQCYILGSFYEDEDDLPCKYDEVFMLKFKDGTEITYNLEDHELEINCVGDVTINGRGIYLNS